MLYKNTPFVWYGGDYNPDQWDEATMEEDMRYFKQAGINVVVLPVFSWAKLEPKEGEYHFEWLDKILNKLWEHRIYVVLATPTTAQPAWMSRKYPEMLPVDIAGRKRTHGMRVFFCVNNDKYRERAAAIADQMGKQYQDYPGLAAWHVSNEYGTYCYCENCQRRFRSWLKMRYQTIENLNDKWTTSFWGRTVYEFEEVMLPTELNDDYRFNPAVQLDYMRFVTDSTLECFQNEAEILRRYTPEVPLFSNISGFIKKLNQYKLVEHMDYAAWDNYPGPKDDLSLPALKHDIMRSLKDGKPYIIAEQSPNQQNWQPYNKLKRPGEVRTIAYQGLARGADACLYFQMRQSVGGQEKFHGAVISHEGTGDTRIFREIADLGKELEHLGDIFLGSRIESKVGFYFDWDSWWALELCSGPTIDMDYLTQVQKFYKAFYDQNIQTDIIKVTTNLERYQVIVAPLLYIVTPEIADRLSDFVKNGGTLIATYRTGVADENDRCVFGAPPGILKNLLGVWVEETDALFPEEKNRMEMDYSKLFSNSNDEIDNRIKSYDAGFLCDVIRPTTAETLAVYGKDFYQGSPCVTVNSFGKGKAYYIACEPDNSFLSDFTEEICKAENIVSPFVTEGKVETSTRTGKNGKIIFIINHGEEEAKVNFGKDSFENLLDGAILSGNHILAPRDVLIVCAVVKED